MAFCLFQWNPWVHTFFYKREHINGEKRKLFLTEFQLEHVQRNNWTRKLSFGNHHGPCEVRKKNIYTCQYEWRKASKKNQNDMDIITKKWITKHLLILKENRAAFWWGSRQTLPYSSVHVKVQVGTDFSLVAYKTRKALEVLQQAC